MTSVDDGRCRCLTTRPSLTERPESYSSQPGRPLRIGTWNIRSGHQNRLDMALRAVAQSNLDLGILTETCLTTEKHTNQSFGYDVIASTANATSGSGVAVFFRHQDERFHVESMTFCGPNVTSFNLIYGSLTIRVVGAYIPPTDVEAATVNQVASACAGQAEHLILLGDLNCNVDNAVANI